MGDQIKIEEKVAKPSKHAARRARKKKGGVVTSEDPEEGQGGPGQAADESVQAQPGEGAEKAKPNAATKPKEQVIQKVPEYPSLDDL